MCVGFVLHHQTGQLDLSQIFRHQRNSKEQSVVQVHVSPYLALGLGQAQGPGMAAQLMFGSGLGQGLIQMIAIKCFMKYSVPSQTTIITFP
jgi:hypothetical protein